MSDPKTLEERFAACCPCLRRQTHSDSSFGPCKDRSCRCYFMGDGVDACLWPGHAVEAEVGEMDTALRTTQKWLRASRERAEAAEALLTEAPNPGYGQNAQRWTDEEYWPWWKRIRATATK